MSREVLYTTTTSTLIEVGDIGNLIEANNDSTEISDVLTIYIPADEDPLVFNDQDEIRVLRSDGNVSIAAATGSGVYINGSENGSVSIFKVYGLATLIKIEANKWAVAGDVIGDLDTELGIPQARIPSLSDPANIQTAFNNYHYGTDGVITNPDNLVDGSIAKYLYVLNTKVEASGAGDVVMNAIEPETDLNALITSGHYYSVLEPADDLNYPITGASDTPVSSTVPGILSVYKAAATGVTGVTQVYQSLPSSNSISPIIWSRSSTVNNAASWTAWVKVSPIDLTNYYTKTQIDNKKFLENAQITSPTNNQVLTYDGGLWVNKTPSSTAGYSFFKRYVYTAATNNLTLAGLASGSGASVRALHVFAVGGGGGGGGASGGGGTDSPYSEGSGGAGGQYAEKWITDVSSLTNCVASVGTGGSGGNFGNGLSGVDSWFGANSSSKLVVAKGGGYGFGDSTATLTNSTVSGGTSTTSGGFGDLVIPGGDGGKGLVRGGDALGCNYGGSSLLSGSVQGSRANDPGNPGLFPGGGGSGASDGSITSDKAGGNGAPGIIIIDVYV